MPGDYFVSLPMIEALAAWARQTHRLTRRRAEELVQRAHLAFSLDPGIVVTVTRYPGPDAPPPTVEWSDCWQWITLQPAVPEERGPLLLPHAIELVEAIARDATEGEWMQRRAALLSQWLHAQQEA
jgi:hypothetical protein